MLLAEWSSDLRVDFRSVWDSEYGLVYEMVEGHALEVSCDSCMLTHIVCWQLFIVVCIWHWQRQTSDGRPVRRHTTPVTVTTTHHVTTTMTSSSTTLDRAPARVTAVSSPVLANQLVTGSCRELRSGLPVVRSPNKSMERPLGWFVSLFVLCEYVCVSEWLTVMKKKASVMIGARQLNRSTGQNENTDLQWHFVTNVRKRLLETSVMSDFVGAVFCALWPLRHVYVCLWRYVLWLNGAS